MKKRNVVTIALSVALSTSLFASINSTEAFSKQKIQEVKLSKKQLKEINENTPLFKKNGIKVQGGYDLPKLGIYELKTVVKTPRGPMEVPAFMDKDTKVVFVGSAYDPEGNKITPPVNKNIVNEGIAFTFGSGKGEEIYLFTDPECPFCRKLETEKGKNLENYTVHVILFPLSFHKQAKPQVQWILRGKNDAERRDRMKKVLEGSDQWMKDLGFSKKNYQKDYNDYMYVLRYSGKKDLKPADRKKLEELQKKFFENEKELEEFKQYLDKAAKSFNEAGAKGTPTITNNKFKKMNPAAL